MPTHLKIILAAAAAAFAVTVGADLGEPARAETPQPAGFGAAAQFDAVARWLPADTIMAGVADTTVGPGLEFFAPLMPGACPKAECSDTAAERRQAAIERLRRLYKARFRAQLGFDPTRVERVAFGFGPSWATVVVHGDLDFQPTGDGTRQVAGETIYKLDAKNRVDPTMWALPLDDGAGLVLTSHPAAFATALAENAAGTLAGADSRRDALRKRLADTADAVFAVAVDVEPDSLTARAIVVSDELQLPLQSTMSLDADGTFRATSLGGQPPTLESLFGSRLDVSSWQRKLWRSSGRDHLPLPLKSVLGIFLHHAAGGERRYASTDDGSPKPTEQQIELGITPPISIAAAWGAMSVPSLQKTLTGKTHDMSIDRGTERLRRISEAAADYIRKSRKTVDGEVVCQLPPSSEPTRPPDACCQAGTPSPADPPPCTTAPQTWQAEAWRALDISIDAPHGFAFQIVTEGDGWPPNRVAVRAKRIRACGSEEIIRLEQEIEVVVEDGECNARMGPVHIYQ